MLIANELPRIFLFDNEGTEVELADPNSEFRPASVLNFYSATYPVLTTAKIEGPEINKDRVEYRFIANLGTKG